MKKKTLIILGAGFLLRLIWILLVKVEPVSDSNMYELFARNIFEGNGYAYEAGVLTAYWPVGTSAVYAALFKVFGYTYVVIEVFNLIIGTGIMILTYRLAKRFFGDGIPDLALLLLALWPLLIQFSTILASELIFLFLLLLSMEFWFNRKINRLLRIILWAFFLTLATYVRTVSLPILLLFPVLESIHEKRIQSFILPLILGILVSSLLFTPWVLRNYRLYDEFVLVATNSGTNLWMGNNPESNGGYMKLPETDFANHVERNNFFKQEAVDFILENPGEYIKLCMKRIAITFKSETIGVVWNEGFLRKHLSPGGLFALKAISSLFWLLVLLSSLSGIILYLLSDIRNVFNPLLLVMLFFWVIPVLIVGQDRYHIPAIPFMSVFASYGITSMYLYLKKIKHKKTGKQVSK